MSSTRTRKMYDSVSVSAIPRTAALAAGYVDGRYANVDELRKRLPKATIVTITVLGTPGANVCDCETGDLTPRSAARWAAGEIKAGRRPTIYCLASQLRAVKRAVALRLPRRRALVSYWVASYDGVARVPAGVVAKQYADPAVHHRGQFDLSVVAAHWPGVDPAPKPPVKKPAAKPPVIAPAQPASIVAALRFLLARKKAIVAAVFGIASWGVTALQDGHISQPEWIALFIALAGATGVHQVKNRTQP